MGYLSIPGMPLDIKSHILNAGDGYLLRGVYVSGRSAGNFLAGRNAAYAEQNWHDTINAAGLLHSLKNDTDRNARYRGEIPSAGRWIRRGFSQASREMYRNGVIIYK